ncbi:low molecular weight phosphotyrosine protein phosphatase [Mesorhizobium sp. ESP6-5]|uniref:protein-tyrosine-phosphatase n=1 Tax=Mesorhizobium australicum (strain HAMBI 3006 / LMG 24608 / WSM2073) TaxID=754035 RepID=L0KGG2_MESAW|nr:MULTISPECIES: low molecular weight protein-tyrosine-phosphatase [Mesorhizobium]MBZ9930829.1 low molecular weight phosphotyrosine protein phosphatase [Mesorhizobium sp. BR1-1-5]AGB43469.1 protein-tyrosine-phosphatase [Mesorhizobium australicum WSM2073]MBZ9679555.1 low molecular weight phosphotyrosine protein phosphatase [Mesorhizobium sp. CO1-1-2]MBZ9696072.1 low molecular weight phosphotyrosine protein phosphatase [Mesorhizobium sp. CO1-1-9]MBZ9726864.1 low molecular weight phosphotyrosine 
MIAKPINSILFVCLGNICRSPLAEGILGAVLAERGYGGDIVLDSAATSGWEVGSAPDPRSIAIASHHGIDISRQRARKIMPEDFHRFDLIFGMDRSNVADLKALAPAAVRDRIHLFLEFAEGRPRDVPDPYYEDQQAFAEVYRMIREASEVLATRLAARVSTPDSGHASSTI